MMSDIAEGLVYCRRTPWIIWTISIAGLVNALVFAPSAVLVPLYFRRVLHTSSWVVGLAFAAFGLGGVLGSLLMMGRQPRRRVRFMWLAWSVGTLLAVPFGLSHVVWLAVALVVVMGALLMLGNILWQSLMQAEVSGEILGRVSSVDWVVSLGLSPVGVALAGLVADRVGVRTTIAAPGAVVAVLGLVLLVAVRSITAIDRRVGDGPSKA